MIIDHESGVTIENKPDDEKPPVDNYRPRGVRRLLF
jgi:hypothetical protein